MPWHIGCASLEQASTKEAQLEVTSDREPQHPGESVCWISASRGKYVLDFPGLVVSSLLLRSKQCSPALPCPKGCAPRALSPCTRRSSPAAEPGHGMGLGLAGTSQPKSLQL